jgi:hypothetical protein
MRRIDNKLLSEFVQEAADQLAGDWVIVGGSVLQLLNIDIRVTTDIDLAGPENATQKDTLTLMEIAADLGLPVEAINQAASYFLFKIPDWQSSLVLVKDGKRGRVLRPNASLFIKLKLPRLTASDLDDCMAMLAFAQKHREKIEFKSIEKLMKADMKVEQNSEKKRRMQVLWEALSE